jgi:hypothetical protein
MVKKTGLARKVQQQNSQDELWKKTEALLDAMGWQVEVNVYSRCWTFRLGAPGIQIRFDLSDAMLKEFRTQRSVGPLDNDPETDRLWLAAIERLALKWYLEATSFEEDFRRDAGLPPAMEKKTLAEVHIDKTVLQNMAISPQGEISPALAAAWGNIKLD